MLFFSPPTTRTCGEVSLLFTLVLVSLPTIPPIFLPLGSPCQEVLVSMNTGITDKDFGYHSILGRYSLVISNSAVWLWKQLNGRRSLVLGPKSSQ